MVFLRKCILFYLGGFAYFVLELLWRGRSYGSMFLLGGICFLVIGWLNRRLHRLALWLRMLLSAVTVTGLELLAGLLVNRNFQVWDYRRMPCNYLGQVCLNYSLLWIPVSLAAMVLYEGAQRFLPGSGGQAAK